MNAFEGGKCVGVSARGPEISRAPPMNLRFETRADFSDSGTCFTSWRVPLLAFPYKRAILNGEGRVWNVLSSGVRTAELF